MKEHAGGVPNTAFDSSGGVCEPTKCYQFDWDSVDTLEDAVREALARREPIGPILAKWLEGQEQKIRKETVSAMIALVLDSKNPGAQIWQIAAACGVGEAMAITGPQMAKHAGVTKQAMQQGTERWREKLGLPQTHLMRNEQEKETMRRNNYRKAK